jgi:hypothetical protein
VIADHKKAVIVTDPQIVAKIKAKLAEFRAHLKEFEKAANGSGQN